MGYKVFTIAAMKPGRGLITSSSHHDPEAAREIVARLGFPHLSHSGPSDYETAMYPSDGSLHVGAYPEGVLISNTALVEKALQKHALLDNFFTLFPDHEILVLALHSVVNSWGYAYCRNGQIIRRHCGDADNGVLLNEGEMLPEEIELFAESDDQGGEPIWRRTIKGREYVFPMDAMGEEFVFSLSKRVFGESLPELDAEEIRLDRYVDSRPWWRRCIGF